MSRGLKNLLLLGIISVFSISAANTSFAGGRLSEDMIRSFIEETTRITKVTDEDFSTSAAHAYLEKHLHEKARFKSTMRYTIPGHDPQSNSISMNKEDYITSISKSPDSVGDYDNEVEIQDIRIAKDGGNATVTTKSTEKGYINVSADQKIPMEGVSTCNQIIVLSKSNVIQMYSAQCTTEVQFTEMGF